MTELFLNTLNKSISASWLILAVLVLRFLLKRAPKWIHVLLWGMVAVRLLCPVFIESDVSLVPSAQTVRPEIMTDWSPRIDTGIPVLDDAVNPVAAERFAPRPEASANPLQIFIPICAWIWMLGVAVLLLYTTISCWLLQRKVETAVRLRCNIFQSEQVATPFVLGIFKPRIYLPYTMAQQDILYVVAHEKAHIRRRDHWWKPLGFLLLTVHWFNPLMWLAYKLLSRDIELACDEYVIEGLDCSRRAEYAQALLACSVKPSVRMACPIAFGEVGVRTRIRSIANYKKSAFWLILTAVLVCSAAAVCFLTDPKTEAGRTVSAQETVSELSALLELTVPGKTYQDMDPEDKAGILGEYGNLLDGYALTARESTDGTVCYIAGCFEGDLEDNPLNGLKSYIYGEDFIQILGSAEEIKEAEEALQSQLAPQASFTLRRSRMLHEPGNGTILIEPKDTEAKDTVSLVFAYSKYCDPSLGGAYIRDAVSRGVALYTTAPYLSVKADPERWGETYEHIPLTNEEFEKILTEERMLAGVGSDFEASLYYLDGTEVRMEKFRGSTGVPPTVLDLAVKVTGVTGSMGTAADTQTVPETTEEADAGRERVRDMAYFMELSVPGREFRDMSPERREEIVSEYGRLLDDYDVIARESTDGSLCYIVGCWGGILEESPFYYLRSASKGNENGEVQVLYDERELEAAEKYQQPEYKYTIHNSHINHSSGTGQFLIHPKDSGWGFNDVFNNYLRPNGRAYMLDAVSRGIALGTPEGPYLEVYRISETWGEISEKIPLTEEEAARILGEDRKKLESGIGFSARLYPGPSSSLNLEGEAGWFTEFLGVPQTVLDLAAEKCGYQFAAPRDIRSDIVEARLDCDWLEEPRYVQSEDLEQLQTILRNAEFGFAGKCGYNARLTIRMADGSDMVLFKGTDSCDTLVFGSYGGYFIGDAENLQFWTLFGLDSGTKQPLG